MSGDGLEDDLDDDQVDDPDEPTVNDPKLSFIEQRSMLLRGLTFRDLAELFACPKERMRRALVDIEPVGHRRNYPIYNIVEVAYRFIQPTDEQINEAIQNMAPKDLPPSMQRAFWNSQRERQKFAEERGELWHTQRVATVIADLLMLVRQRLVLATDHIDRMNPLNDEQRGFVQATFDGIIVDLRNMIIEAFSDYNGDKDRTPDPLGEVIGDGLDLV